MQHPIPVSLPRSKSTITPHPAPGIDGGAQQPPSTLVKVLGPLSQLRERSHERSRDHRRVPISSTHQSPPIAVFAPRNEHALPADGVNSTNGTDDPDDPDAARAFAIAFEQLLDDVMYDALNEERQAEAETGGTSIRVGRHRLSGAPKVIDDFSGRTMGARIREAAEKLKNLDGPDDLSSALGQLLPLTGSPYAVISVLSVLFLLVLLAAVGATRNAKKGYYTDYPAAVKSNLAMQQRLIDTLKTQGVPAHALAQLQKITTEGRERFDRRAGQRAEGIGHLVAHNASTFRQKGNADLSREFAALATPLIAQLVRRIAGADAQTDSDGIRPNLGPLDVDGALQFRRTQVSEIERDATKQSRVISLLSAFGIDAMTLAMVTSAGSSSGQAVVNAADAGARGLNRAGAAAAENALGIATGALLIPAQVAQGTAGLARFAMGRKAREHLHRDAHNVAALGDSIAPDARTQHAETSSYLLRKNCQGMATSAVLSASQYGMMGTTIASMAGAPGPITAPIALVMAGATIGSAVAAGRIEGQLEKFAGADASDIAKDRLATGDLRPALRVSGLADTTTKVANDYAALRFDMAEVKVWSDICRSMSTAALLSDDEITPHEAERRYQKVVKGGTPRKSPASMLKGNRAVADEIRSARYPVEFMKLPALEINRRLFMEIMNHPLAELAMAAPDFRKKLMFDSCAKLAKSEDPEIRALFENDDGKRIDTLGWDRFSRFVESNITAQKIYLRACNRLMTDSLMQLMSWSREDLKLALEDLAAARALYVEAGVAPPEATWL